MGSTVWNRIEPQRAVGHQCNRDGKPLQQRDFVRLAVRRRERCIFHAAGNQEASHLFNQ